ncbi:MAG: hypothetical protein LBU80_01735 [Rikenellaceae bacterium]|jgi:uncharacterized membrane protein SirB2|nr:hypothetical protein [Rikenellaceae bacterium]
MSRPHFPPQAVNTLIVVAGVVLGALLRRDDFLAVGHWLTVAALGYYVAVSAPAAIGRLRHFRELPEAELASAVIFICLTVKLVRSVITHSVGYFGLLALLTVDFLLEAKTRKQ